MADLRMTPLRLGLIFAGFYVLIACFALAVIVALDVFFAYQLNGNFLSLLVPMLSAMQTGTIWFNRIGMRPTKGRAWTAALFFTVITLALNAVAVWLLFALGMLPELRDLWLYPDGPQIMATVLGVVAVLVLLVSRIGIGLGVWQAAKVKQKRDGEGT